MPEKPLSPTAARTLARLLAPEADGPLARLCALGLDHVLSRRLDELVDPARLRDAVTAAMVGPGLDAAVARHIGPGITRSLERARARDERLQAWVPESVAGPLEQLLAQPFRPDPEEVRRGVRGDAIRQMLSTVVQEALSRFVRSGEGVAGVAGGVGAGLMGLVGKGAGKLRDAGKGLLGGLGDEIERQVQRRIRDALDASMAPLQDRLVEWILSDETARALGKARARAFRSVLRRRVAEAAELPLPQLLALLPIWVRHNLGRPEVQEAIAAELDALLEVEGGRTLGELLGEAGVLEQVRADLLAQMLPQARALVDGDAFADWLAALLSD